MSITRVQLASAAEALRLVLALERPADQVLHDFFDAHRSLGARDRAFVAEAVYGVLRSRRTVDRLAPADTPRRQLLAWLVRPAGKSIRELGDTLTGDERQWLAEIKATPPAAATAAELAELPDWLAAQLTAGFGEAVMLEAARAWNQPAPLDLRVNTLKSTREEALARLTGDGLPACATPWSPVGIRITGRPPINQHPLYRDGTLEVQDEGSQLLAFLVAPRRHELVVDFCAGAGGKSLMLGALMHSHGRLYAFDVSAGRLARLRPRLRRSGLSNLHTCPISSENDMRVKRLAGKAHRVLVDAPCSGLGTLRRNPDLKWRHTPATVRELAAKQASILRAAAGLVRPGGRLVYATCSPLRDENEEVVAAFQRERPDFVALDCERILCDQGIAITCGAALRLWPHVHGTDGFYAAALERAPAGGRRPLTLEAS